VWCLVLYILCCHFYICDNLYIDLNYNDLVHLLNSRAPERRPSWPSLSGPAHTHTHTHVKWQTIIKKNNLTKIWRSPVCVCMCDVLSCIYCVVISIFVITFILIEIMYSCMYFEENRS
jgi:hypothetical protein